MKNLAENVSTVRANANHILLNLASSSAITNHFIVGRYFPVGNHGHYISIRRTNCKTVEATANEESPSLYKNR